MSRDVYETYERAIALSTDDGQAPGLLLLQIEAAFALRVDDPFALYARNALWRRVGLVRCEIVVDGPNFDVPCRYQGPDGWPAWIMPIMRTPGFAGGQAEYEDLVAFCDDGRHAGKVWRLLGAVAEVGLERSPAQRLLTIFTQPKLWLAHWLSACLQSENPQRMLDAEETGPESLAALVLDPKRVPWRPIVDVHSSVPLNVDEIRFADSPALRDHVLKEMQLKLPKLPRLRAAKGLAAENA